MKVKAYRDKAGEFVVQAPGVNPLVFTNESELVRKLANQIPNPSFTESGDMFTYQGKSYSRLDQNYLNSLQKRLSVPEKTPASVNQEIEKPVAVSTPKYDKPEIKVAAPKRPVRNKLKASEDNSTDQMRICLERVEKRIAGLERGVFDPDIDFYFIECNLRSYVDTPEGSALYRRLEKTGYADKVDIKIKH